MCWSHLFRFFSDLQRISLIIGVQYVVAGYIGPELPCLLAGGSALIFYIIAEKAVDIRFVENFFLSLIFGDTRNGLIDQVADI
jgi:hypothetical protein